MADIGRSTVSHLSRHEILYPEGFEALDNWAAWYRCSDGGQSSSKCSPMFRDMKTGYREASNLRGTYSEEYALAVDRLMARVLKANDFQIVVCRFVQALDSRTAALKLSRGGDRISVDDYRLRLEGVIASVDMAINLAVTFPAHVLTM